MRKLNENLNFDEPGGNGGPGEACNLRPLPPEEALLGRTAAMLGLVRLRWHSHRSSSNGATHHDRPCSRHLVNNKFTAESTSKLGNKSKALKQRRPKYELRLVYALNNWELREQFVAQRCEGVRDGWNGASWGVWAGDARGPPKGDSGGDKERGNESTALLFHTPRCQTTSPATSDLRSVARLSTPQRLPSVLALVTNRWRCSCGSSYWPGLMGFAPGENFCVFSLGY